MNRKKFFLPMPFLCCISFLTLNVSYARDRLIDYIDDTDKLGINSNYEKDENRHILDADLLPLEFIPPSESDNPDDQGSRKPAKTIQFNFEDADLKVLIEQMEALFNVTFLVDNAVDPMTPEGKSIDGHRISYKTQRPLSQQEAWNLFITFLDLSGFALSPEGLPRIYRIKSIEQARKSPLPTFIGIDPEKLPEGDELIRYIYFIRNSSPKTFDALINSFRSSSSSFSMLADELKAFVLTDKAYNVKTIMRIVKALDKTAEAQSMSVIKLRQADALDVAKLYQELLKVDDPGYGPRALTQRKQSTSSYFPENVSIFAEPRSNALIVLGPENSIKKVEDFIIKYVDVELDQPYSPLFIYQVHYADAQSVADVMNAITAFKGAGQKDQIGGVRAGDKFLKPMNFTPVQTTNQIIVKGDYEDYMRAKEIMDSLDEPQPQVAIEVLLVSVDTNKAKELGTQIRSKVPGADGLIGKNVNFQTSGIKFGRSSGSSLIPKVQNQDGSLVSEGAKRLLGNLLNTVLRPGIAQAGSTAVTLGVDACGVWGIFNVLESISTAEVISNPFLVATNKTKAKVKVGQTRRVITDTVVSGDNEQSGFGDFNADLTLDITPQINSDGMIVLKITISNDEFIGTGNDQSTAAKTTRVIDTETILADKEVLAIGGLIQNKTNSTITKVPILGDIPIFGWLFKNKSKVYQKNNILALISVRIVQPGEGSEFNDFTNRHMNTYYDSLNYMHGASSEKDPVTRLFFSDKRDSTDRVTEDLIFNRTKTPIPQEEVNKGKLISRKNRIGWTEKRERRHRRRDRSSFFRKKKKAQQPVQEESKPRKFDSLTEETLSEMLASHDLHNVKNKPSFYDLIMQDGEGLV